MSWLQFESRANDPEVLIVSQRRLWPVVSRCLLFQFEDFVAAHHPADLIAPLTPAIRRAGVRRAVSKVGRVFPAAGRLFAQVPPTPARRYKLLLVSCEQLTDLMQLGSIDAWKDIAETTVCYVEELWRHRLEERTGELALVRQFDHVFVGCHGAVEALSKAIGRPCRYLPPSVDALSLCPYPRAPHRAIDFYAMGRRNDELHRVLLERSAERDFFYLFDTTQNVRVPDHREHRMRLAMLIKRTRYFLANWARFPDLDVTNGQQEVGLRFFEGAAAGTVMIGEPPNTEIFKQLFGWEDAVIRLPCNSSAVVPLLQALDADPERVEAIRRRNVSQSLERHDFAYRWLEIASTLGFEARPAVHERVRQLRSQAARVRARDDRDLRSGSTPRAA